MLRTFYFILFFLSSFFAFATHNRAGEITYVQTGPNSIKITVTTYTKASSKADRPYIELFWGDGKTENLVRATGYPKLYGADLNINVYEATHTYPSGGNFSVVFEDPNREDGVINIPNSVNTPFYIVSNITLNSFLGNNNSPQLLYPPIDDACLGKKYLHNPGAYDAEGDSLSFSLVNCKGTSGVDVPGYFLPSGCSINSKTGDFVWNTPNKLGDYNFAILIEEFRNGYKIGSVLRDMQVVVEDCPKQDPPVLSVIENICIEAGKSLKLKIHAKDPNVGDTVTLTAVSGMFSLGASAPQFLQPFVAKDSVSGFFTWNPLCTQVKKLPYTVLFKAADNGKPVRLFDLKTVNITVIAPAPKNLQATLSGKTVVLSWLPGLCGNVSGYKIYRKEDVSSYTPDTCETGIPAALGFSLLNTSTGTATGFTDLDVVVGKKYCYRVIAYYTDGAESKASQEVCVELKRTVPVIINVSVTNTHSNVGSIFVKWMKASEIDFAQHPGPYLYKIYRNGNLINTLANVNDTSLTDGGINTQNTGYTYTVELWGNASGNLYLIGTSAPANSVYLSVYPQDKSLLLQWAANVPWLNNKYYIYKETPTASGIFVLIDSTSASSYVNRGLVNGNNYCYKILSSGKYTGTGYPSPLLNFSEIRCGIPKDTVPPCPPIIAIAGNCMEEKNTISWSPSTPYCSGDLHHYTLHYKEFYSGDFTKLEEFSLVKNQAYSYASPKISGCFALTATDSTGNESKITDEQCFEYCSEYVLPNFFSPNGDGFNDFFVPFPFKNIEKINIKIFNRWGVPVFETQNPNIFWDGRNYKNQQMCSSGTYFYVCEVQQKRLAGIIPIVLKGYITLVGDGFNNK